MEPAVSLSAYALINGAVLVILALVGYDETAVWLVVGVVVWTALLLLGYALHTRGDVLPDHRRRLDRLVLGQVAGFALAVTLVAVALGGSWELSMRTHQYFEFLGGALLVASLSTWLSSLIDWFWVLPRLAGFGLANCPPVGGEPTEGPKKPMHRPAPCQDVHADTWNGLTKVWLFHRGIATLFFIGGMAGIPGYLTAATHNRTFAVLMGILTLGVPAVLSEQAAAAVKALTNGLNPSAPVGSLLRIRMLKIVDVYLVDASLQGSKFKLIGQPEAGDTPGWTRKSDGPQIPNEVLRSINMAQVLRPDTPGIEQVPVSPCGWSCEAEACNRVNWYCRYNERAYSRRG